MHKPISLFKTADSIYPVYKFRVGQTVLLLEPYGHGPPDMYVIVRELPERDGEAQYRLRKKEDFQERVAKESQLRAV